ncbi:MAG: GNAT family N-acetyltransferase, partial [Chloroflexi bacterium]|nr:GNAT family N-acetyltransferase [Chloroflexota bacterium]
LNADADVDDLYDVSHRTEAFKQLWRYLWNGPFASRDEMHRWLVSVQDGSDPMFYTVFSRALGRKVGMFSLLNIVPEMGRLEFGHIWYSPLVQRTKVNTEVTYLFLCHTFEDLRYRRVEWKCDNRNEPSKRTMNAVAPPTEKMRLSAYEASIICALCARETRTPSMPPICRATMPKQM